MSYYDDIYHRVQEMNRDWRHRVAEIRSDAARVQVGIPTRPRHLQTVAIIATDSEAQIGKVTVNDRGDLHTIDLDAYAVHGMYSEHVAAAIVTAINKATSQALQTRIREGIS
ncbi:hypothetical protein ABZ894_28855 [Nocardia beijingensis]|uniref:hypothetical protein n=1 Tax=Nocardia beijingensis TaxID=95162 RepID=UPI0033C0A046